MAYQLIKESEYVRGSTAEALIEYCSTDTGGVYPAGGDLERGLRFRLRHPRHTDDPEEVAGYYYALMQKAAEAGCVTLAIPIFPTRKHTDLASRDVLNIATKAVQDFCQDHEMMVTLLVKDQEQVPADEGLLLRLKAFISANWNDDQKKKYESGRREQETPAAGGSHHFFSHSSYCLDLDALDFDKTPAVQPAPFEELEDDAELDHLGLMFALEPKPRPDAADKIKRPSKKEPSPPQAAKKPQVAPRKPAEEFLKAEKSQAKPSVRPMMKPMAPAAAAPVGFDPAKSVFHLDESFAEAVLRLIDKNGLTDPQCYSRSNLSKAVFNKLKQSALNPKVAEYKPSKETALALTIGLKLSLDEAKQLLEKAGYAISHSSKRDLIVEYFLKNRMYDIDDLNIMLYDFKEKPLGSC